MGWWLTEEHEDHVDRLLVKLRRAMLGFQAPCLPKLAPRRSKQRRAIRAAAERLALCFAVANAPVSASALQDCRSRLYATMTYLFFECLPTDRTFEHVLRLMESDVDLFSEMTARARHTPRSFLRHYRRIRSVEGNVESAVLLCLAQDGRLPSTHLCTLAAERAIKTIHSGV